MASRLYRHRTHCLHGHEFTPENTYVRKDGHRQCKACARFRVRQWQQKARAEGRVRPVNPEWHREYRRRVRAREHVPTPRVKERIRVTSNVIDLLEVDGGWLTADGLAMAIGCDPKSAYRVLMRLRDRGVVRSRLVELAGRDTRLEWAAA